MKKQMTKKLRSIPHFKTEAAERRFWAKHDSADYISWGKATRNAAFPELGPSVHTVSLRLSDSLLNDLKRLAHQKDVPYQSLMKIFLSQKVREEAA